MTTDDPDAGLEEANDDAGRYDNRPKMTTPIVTEIRPRVPIGGRVEPADIVNAASKSGAATQPQPRARD